MMRNPRVKSVALVLGGAILAMILYKLPTLVSPNEMLDSSANLAGKAIVGADRAAHGVVRGVERQMDGNRPTPNLWLATQNGAYADVVDALNQGADVNKPKKSDSDAPGWTPLMYAVKSRNVEIVKLLVSNGANVDYEVEGTSPVSLAFGDEQILKALEKG